MEIGKAGDFETVIGTVDLSGVFLFGIKVVVVAESSSWDSVSFLVFTVSFALSQELKQDTEEYDKGKRNKNSEGTVSPDSFKGLKNSCEQVEAISKLHELESN